jgi:hypothetical protein
VFKIINEQERLKKIFLNQSDVPFKLTGFPLAMFVGMTKLIDPKG